MRCPHCQSKSAVRVVKTQKMANSVRRRRRCTACRRSFHTYEVNEQDLTLRKINELNAEPHKRDPSPVT